ncbi:MAG: response regulator, partial [Gemmatimonadaceae bacterium]
MTTILLVEDNETLALGLRSNLEFEGYDVLSAGTAADALTLAATHRPDLMILDLMLPDSDGFRVLRELRGRE